MMGLVGRTRTRLGPFNIHQANTFKLRVYGSIVVCLLIGCALLALFTNYTELHAHAAETAVNSSRNVQLPSHVLEWLEQVLLWMETITQPCGALKALGADDFICEDVELAVRPPCLVYQFGLGTASLSFDLVMSTELGCRTRTFDPRIENSGPLETTGLHLYRALLHSHASRGIQPALITLDSALHQLDPDQPLDYLRVHLDGQESLLLMQQTRGTEDSTLVLDKVRYISLVVPLPEELHSLPSVFRLEMLATGSQVLHELGFRVMHCQRLADAGTRRYPGLWRATGGEDKALAAAYRVLLVRSGRDVWDRMERRTPSRRNYIKLNPQLVG